MNFAATMVLKKIKKNELIDIIQNLDTFSQPKLRYEQYMTDAVATSDLLFHIAYTHRDLEKSFVVDMGCGAGNLTIAAALLGAKVLAVDVDPDALNVLQKNIEEYDLGSQVTVLQHDITSPDFPETIRRLRETLAPGALKTVVISNPPFGVHQKGIDVKFLSQAFQFSNIIYSIHLSSPKIQKYLGKKIARLGGILTERSTLYLFLTHTYKFHTKSRKKIMADVYRIEVKEVQ